MNIDRIPRPISCRLSMSLRLSLSLSLPVAPPSCSERPLDCCQRLPLSVFDAPIDVEHWRDSSEKRGGNVGNAIECRIKCDLEVYSILLEDVCISHLFSFKILVDSRY